MYSMFELLYSVIIYIKYFYLYIWRPRPVLHLGTVHSPYALFCL